MWGFLIGRLGLAAREMTMDNREKRKDRRLRRRCDGEKEDEGTVSVEGVMLGNKGQIITVVSSMGYEYGRLVP